VDFRDNSENVRKTVSEHFNKKEGYTIQEEHNRIWTKTLGQLIDITQKKLRNKENERAKSIRLFFACVLYQFSPYLAFRLLCRMLPLGVFPSKLS